VIPWSAQYDFPTLANKAQKTTPRLPPKNGSEFKPGNVIRLEFPAQGYVNPNNTTLVFDVTLFSPLTPRTSTIRFQNNIQSIFTRGRILYGSTPLEDIVNYNVIVRMLTEWTTTTGQTVLDQTTITEGLGGIHSGVAGPSGLGTVFAPLNTRQLIQGLGFIEPASGAKAGFGSTPNNRNASSVAVPGGQFVSTRRYSVTFPFGLFSQSKLIPTKYMASQLAIELTLAAPQDCLFLTSYNIGEASGAPLQALGLEGCYYVLNNVNLIPEILEFDVSYDMMFLKGLNEGGVPIKFASWHTFQFNTGGSSTVNLTIQERSRSVKALFTVVRRASPTLFTDAGALFYTTINQDNPKLNYDKNVANTLVNYQYRIGGKYFPAAPVQCASSSGDRPEGAEPFVELQKALNTLGDYRLSAPVNCLRWALPMGYCQVGDQGVALPTDGGSRLGVSINEGDFNFVCKIFSDNGNPSKQGVEDLCYAPAFITSGNVGSTAFTMAIDLETTNGLEISGLNAQEMSDISLLANYSRAQGGTAFNHEVYSYFDCMIVLQPNNNLELIY
jgi:hypothetical protein